MINQLMMEKIDLQAAVKGVVVVNDVGGANADMAKKLSPALAKKAMKIFQVYTYFLNYFNYITDNITP